jgi:hypothetical protein
MKNIEDIISEIEDQAPEAWKRSNGRNWHRLVLTSEGDIYWAEEADQHSMSEAVWKGTDCSLTHFQGQPWNGADEDAHEMIAASAEIAAELEKIADGETINVGASDGESYSLGRKHYGYNESTWYRVGNLLSYSDANPDTSCADYMAQAIEAAEKFWAAKTEE